MVKRHPDVTEQEFLQIWCFHLVESLIDWILEVKVLLTFPPIITVLGVHDLLGSILMPDLKTKQQRLS